MKNLVDIATQPRSESYEYFWDQPDDKDTDINAEYRWIAKGMLPEDDEMMIPIIGFSVGGVLILLAIVIVCRC